jgi:hypothetical protein
VLVLVLVLLLLLLLLLEVQPRGMRVGSRVGSGRTSTTMRQP